MLNATAHQPSYSLAFLRGCRDGYGFSAFIPLSCKHFMWLNAFYLSECLLIAPGAGVKSPNSQSENPTQSRLEDCLSCPT